MNYFFDDSGSMISSTSEKVYQGSDKVNYINFISPIASGPVSVAFTLPNGSVTVKYLMTREDDALIELPEDYGDNPVYVWKFAIPRSVLKDFGTVSLQFFVNVSYDELLSTESGSFAVEHGVYTGEADEEAYSDLREYLVDMHDRTETVLDDIENLQDDLDTAEGNITTLQNDLDTAEGNITTLQNDLTTAEGNINSLSLSVTALQNAINTVSDGEIDGLFS